MSLSTLHNPYAGRAGISFRNRMVAAYYWQPSAVEAAAAVADGADAAGVGNGADDAAAAAVAHSQPA